MQEKENGTGIFALINNSQFIERIIDATLDLYRGYLWSYSKAGLGVTFEKRGVAITITVKRHGWLRVWARNGKSTVLVDHTLYVDHLDCEPAQIAKLVASIVEKIDDLNEALKLFDLPDDK